MQPDQSKNNRLGGTLTGIGIAAFVLLFLVSPIWEPAWFINLCLTISFVALGLAYIVVFVRKEKHTLALIVGTLVGLFFLLIGLVSFAQLVSSCLNYFFAG